MKIMRFFLWSLVFASFAAQADIAVSPIIVDLLADNATSSEIAVKNFDTKHNAYVEVTPYYLSQPGNRTIKRMRVRNPAKAGLVVFPAKLVLLPGQTQYVRLVKAQNYLKQDKVFEVDFVPKVATHLAKQQIGDNGSSIGIRVIVGYSARVTLRPKNMTPSVVVKRLKDELVIKNTGNTQLKLMLAKQVVLGKTQEVELPVHTLFAGQEITKKLAYKSAVTLNVQLMDKPLGVFRTD